MIAVSRSGMQVISVTLFRGRECFMVKAVMRDYIREKVVWLR
jgi:hypothetical protein